MSNCDKIIICAMITLIFVNTNGLSLDLLPSSQLQDEILEAACEFKCIKNEVALKNCSCDSKLNEVLHTDAALNLVCKEANKVVFKLCNETVTRNVYFLETQISTDTSWKYNSKTNSCFIIADKLEQNAKYKYRLWILVSNGTVFQTIESNHIATRGWKDPPLPISAIDLLRLEYSRKQNDYKAVLTWSPSAERSCHHEFVWFGGDDVSDYTQIEVEIPYNNSVTIDKLIFNSNYSVAVMTKSTDWSMESEKVWFHFMTPRCFDVLKSLEFCVPDMPIGVDTHEGISTNQEANQNIYVINVTWDRPSIDPDWYLVHLNTFQEHQNETYNLRNVTGNSTSVMFSNVSLNLHYQITLFAFSKAGRSEPAELYKQIEARNVVKSTLLISNNIFLMLIIPFVTIFCIISSLLFGYKEYTKRGKVNKRQLYFEEFELKSHYLESPLADENDTDKSDEWEIEPSCLTLHNVLGQGAFGVVRKGWLMKRDTKLAVAVKILLDDHRQSDIRDFKQEIEIMKSVGSHPHIVSLIGCCSKGKPSDLRLIVEFCARGDLLTYLRTAWDQITTNQCSNIHYENMNSHDAANFDNKLYLLGVTETWNMQIKDLISIGLQVAMGMEYLSSLHVLHRDLAARNVLVCEDRTVKVSDFGLSRDVYRDNVYCKTSSGKLPIRWLALESLTHQVYTTHSDVWSFGILLWEIITLGGNPYPGVHTHELLDLLVKGYRMNCPSNCSPELYDIMMSCWNSNFKERPSFTEIRQMLERILEKKSEYLDLNLSSSFESLDELKIDDAKTKSVSSERYVKAFAI